MYWEDCEGQRSLVYRDKERTAKKEHECCECRASIKVGEKYLYSFGVWKDYHDSYPYARSYKTCLGCKKDWSEILEVFHENGEDDANIVFGSLSEAIQDAFDAGFLEEEDRLAKKWLNIEPLKPEIDVESLSPEERDNYEREKAVSQMRDCSSPLL